MPAESIDARVGAALFAELMFLARSYLSPEKEKGRRKRR